MLFKIYGGLILMAMALELIAFSAYSFSEAEWRKINMKCLEYRDHSRVTRVTAKAGRK